MFAAGNLDVRDIISARYNLEDTHQAILDAGAGSPGKVMVSQFYGK